MNKLLKTIIFTFVALTISMQIMPSKLHAQWTTTPPNTISTNNQVAIGNPALLNTNTKLLVQNGEINVIPDATLQALSFSTPENGKTSFRHYFSNNWLVTELDMMPPTDSSNAMFRFFRRTNTSGEKRVIFYKGSGLHEISATIGVAGQYSYFQADGGNFGIGTTRPVRPFHVKGGAGTSIVTRIESGNANGATIDFKDPNTTTDYKARIGGKGDGLTFIAGGLERMNVLSNGYVGIGTTTPHRVFHVRGGTGTSIPARIESRSSNVTIDFKSSTTTGDYLARIGGKGDGLLFVAGGAERMNILSNGEVGIGTTSVPTGFKLAVDGKVVCEELQVKLSQNWPDYVFEDDYDLMPLKEVKSFIQDKHHLPGIPSAKEVETEGVSVGSMEAKLLQKVEELTLYIIQQQERIEALEAQINE